MYIIHRKNKGDTIVEVLLAIGIAAFAIGITYATAQRSLNQSITARERNEVLNIAENQLTDLRLRFTKSASLNDFTNVFANGQNHFCLDNSATTPSPNPPWAPYTNYNSAADYEATTLSSSPTPNQYSPYDPRCTYNKNGDGVTYYFDINAAKLAGQSVNPTVYQIFVRWEPIGGGQINQASLYFRPNGILGQSLGYALPDSLATLYAYGGTTDES